MPFLQKGDVDDITIPAGQSIRIGAYRNAMASVSIPYGLRGGPITLVQDGAATIGPYPAGAAVSIKSISGSVEYVVAVTPALTDATFNSAAVAVTGGTINGTSVGATTRSTGAFTSVSANLASNITIAGVGTALTAPSLQCVNSVNSFTQIANQNKNASASASSDMISYPDNNANDLTGFVDIGVCSSVYADASYTITGPNDAYLFGSAVSGAGKVGNLVLCTDSTGSANAIVFGTGGFLAVNEKMRLKAGGALNLKPLASAPVTDVAEGDIYYNLTMHKLQVRTAAAWETITSV